jgi:capsular polysaccharide biosynthesis protein
VVILQEISLRDLIEIMLKGKWFIAIFTIVCILFSGAVSFFFMTPTNEAQTMLMISPITNTASEQTEENIKKYIKDKLQEE